MNCTMCENKKNLKKSNTTFKYKACGLDNVTLIGVVSYRCNECGEEYVSFGNLENLHNTIASVLLKKRDLLTGKEVRFLRKHLGYSGAMFSRLIGYGHEAISRIETGANPVTESFDRLVRFTVAAKLPDREYDLHDQLLNNSGTKMNRIELTSIGHGNWKLKKAA